MAKTIKSGISNFDHWDLLVIESSGFVASYLMMINEGPFRNCTEWALSILPQKILFFKRKPLPLFLLRLRSEYLLL